MKTFSLFLPANTTFLLALLLVPIEFISYIAKPISLGVRLFINLMAGHSLLKVIIGFSWSMLLLENFTSIGLLLPMIILVILFGLELGVALIQTYVFIILCDFVIDKSKVEIFCIKQSTNSLNNFNFKHQPNINIKTL
jgi:F-type H+-transporting ATPase subunit a